MGASESKDANADAAATEEEGSWFENLFKGN